MQNRVNRPDNGARGDVGFNSVPISSLSHGKSLVDRLIFSTGELDELKTKLMALTRATVMVRSPVRNARGTLDYVEMPDNGIQLAATVKALEFAVGKAKVMLDIQTSAGKPISQGADLAKLLVNNADLTLTILQTLKESLRKAQAVDVTPLPEQLPIQPSDPKSDSSLGSDGTSCQVPDKPSDQTRTGE